MSLHLGIGHHGQPLTDTDAQPCNRATNFSLPEWLANLEISWENVRKVEKDFEKGDQSKRMSTFDIEKNLNCKRFYRIVDAEE